MGRLKSDCLNYILMDLKANAPSASVVLYYHLLARQYSLPEVEKYTTKMLQGIPLSKLERCKHFNKSNLEEVLYIRVKHLEELALNSKTVIDNFVSELRCGLKSHCASHHRLHADKCAECDSKRSRSVTEVFSKYVGHVKSSSRNSIQKIQNEYDKLFS